MRFGRLALVVLLAVCGCASMFLHGGELVGKGYQPQVLVNYKAEGVTPAGATYHLVRLEDGREAVFERSSDGSGTLVSNQWRENAEDHFFCWVGKNAGFEYVIPADRTQAGSRYVYPYGTFTSRVENGVEKPNLTTRPAPVATLRPE
jgi:hypothetical protein